MIQIDPQTGNCQTRIVSSICLSQATLGEAFYVSSSSHCWWARSYVAKLTGLIGMEGRQSFGGENEEILHMHTWHVNKVWSLPTFFAEVLARRKAVLADEPFDSGFPLGSEGSRQNASSSPNLAAVQILLLPRVSFRKQIRCLGRPFGLVSLCHDGYNGGHMHLWGRGWSSRLHRTGNTEIYQL